MKKEENVCTDTITKFDVVKNMLKSAIEIIPFYNLSVTTITADLLVYNMNPFERGELFVSRLWILLVMLVEVCSAMIGKVSSEPEILQGSFLTSISVTKSRQQNPFHS
jgi:hypothetical protein